MVFLVITVLSILFLCGVFGRGFVRFVYLSNKIRGPSLWKFVTVHAKPLTSDAMLTHLWKMCESYDYQPWGAWLYQHFTVIISDSESVNEVCQNKNTSNKPNLFYQNIAKYLGNGLISINGAKYRQHKKIMGPAFRKNLLEANMLSYTNEQALKLVDKLHKTNKENFYAPSLMRDEMVDLVFWTLCTGYYQYSDPQRFLDMSNLTKNMIQIQSMNPFYYWTVHKLKQSTRKSEVLVKQFFDDAKNDIKEGVERLKEEKNNAGDWQPSNILETLVKARMEMGGSFSHEDLVSETLTMSIAAFDTNDVTLNLALFLLALHPAVQERIFEEMESIFEQNDRPVESQDLSRMVYLEAFIKETLRLFPALPVIIRNADNDINLNGVLVPKGSAVLIDIFALHRNPENFKDPLKFLPDRFLPENEDKRHPMAYIPFGFGARLCPGYMLAYIVLKIMISHVVRNFKIFPGDGFNSFDDIKVQMNISLKPCQQLPVRVVSRLT